MEKLDIIKNKIIILYKVLDYLLIRLGMSEDEIIRVLIDTKYINTKNESYFLINNDIIAKMVVQTLIKYIIITLIIYNVIF